MAQERGNPLRVIIENVQGPISYIPGGFQTGTTIVVSGGGNGPLGLSVPVGIPGGNVNTGTSNLTGLRVVNDAIGQGIAIASGGAFQSGSPTSGILYVVQSAGISGNQVGIRCFTPIVTTSGGITSGASLSGGASLLTDVASGANLSPFVFKILVQGY